MGASEVIAVAMLSFVVGFVCGTIYGALDTIRAYREAERRWRDERFGKEGGDERD
jgi:hypothetical protein